MLNQVCIAGRLAADPDIRQTKAGLPVANITIACQQDYKPADGERKIDWIDVVAWGKTADFIGRYFKKGSMATVTGRLQTRNWTDKNGNGRKDTEIVADRVYFAGSKRDVGGSENFTGSEFSPIDEGIADAFPF